MQSSFLTCPPIPNAWSSTPVSLTTPLVFPNFLPASRSLPTVFSTWLTNVLRCLMSEILSDAPPSPLHSSVLFLLHQLPQRIRSLADTVPDSTLSHALPVVTVTRRPPPPRKLRLCLSPHVPEPHPVTTAISLPLDLQPLSTYLGHLPLFHCTQYTEPDLSRNVAEPIAPVAADTLSRLPSAIRLSLASFIDKVIKKARRPSYHAASRSIHNLRSACPNGASRLPLAWGPYATTIWSIAGVNLPHQKPNLSAPQTGHRVGLRID